MIAFIKRINGAHVSSPGVTEIYTVPVSNILKTMIIFLVHFRAKFTQVKRHLICVISDYNDENHDTTSEELLVKHLMHLCEHSSYDTAITSRPYVGDLSPI